MYNDIHTYMCISVLMLHTCMLIIASVVSQNVVVRSKTSRHAIHMYIHVVSLCMYPHVMRYNTHVYVSVWTVKNKALVNKLVGLFCSSYSKTHGIAIVSGPSAHTHTQSRAIVHKNLILTSPPPPPSLLRFLPIPLAGML